MTENTDTANPNINNLNLDEILFASLTAARRHQRDLPMRDDDWLLIALAGAVSRELFAEDLGRYNREEDPPSPIDPLMRHIHKCVRELGIDAVRFSAFLGHAHDKATKWTHRGRLPSWTTIAASVHALELSNTGSNEADAADRVLALLLRLSRMDYASRYYINAHDRGPDLSQSSGRFRRAIATIESLAEQPVDAMACIAESGLEARQRVGYAAFPMLRTYDEEADTVRSILQRARIALLRTLSVSALIPEPNIPAIDAVLAKMPGYASPETCTLAEAIAFQLVYLELFDASCTALDTGETFLKLRERFGIKNVPVVVA